MLEMTRGKVSRVKTLPSPRPGSSSLPTLGVGRMEVAAGSGVTEVTEDRGCEYYTFRVIQGEWAGF